MALKQALQASLASSKVTSPKSLLTNAIYLEDSVIELFGIIIYGTPWWDMLSFPSVQMSTSRNHFAAQTSKASSFLLFDRIFLGNLEWTTGLSTCPGDRRCSTSGTTYPQELTSFLHTLPRSVSIFRRVLLKMNTESSSYFTVFPLQLRRWPMLRISGLNTKSLANEANYWGVFRLI